MRGREQRTAYAEDLDALMPAHASPRDGRLELTMQCHPAAGARVSYAQGVVDLRCAACGMRAPSIHVARQPPRIILPGRGM